MYRHVGIGYRIRFKQGIGTAFGQQMLVALRADLTIDDDVRHVDPLGTQLARHALGEGAQGEFGGS